jgi:hypothetical protein
MLTKNETLEIKVVVGLVGPAKKFVQTFSVKPSLYAAILTLILSNLVTVTVKHRLDANVFLTLNRSYLGLPATLVHVRGEPHVNVPVIVLNLPLELLSNASERRVPEY